MRLIDIEPCEKLGHAMVLYATEGGMLIQIRSSDMPTIDAVPVVRCKDCKHYDKRSDYCEGMGFSCLPDDFCSCGERKDGGK